MIYLIRITALIICTHLFVQFESSAQCSGTDYDALVALYNATDGANWTNTWDLTDCNVCGWYGVRCFTDERVTSLILESNNLIGSIPSELGNLDFINTLWLTNNQLTGSIPPELGNLVNLESLILNDNNLIGNIPSELGNLINLRTLRITNNQLSGSIPSELGNLTTLKNLSLSSNQLTGRIPQEFGNLLNLEGLALGSNQLSGNIPPILGDLVNLTSLGFSFNQLSGTIPQQLGDLVSLITLLIQGNELTGSIPASFSELTNLIVFNVSFNQLSGCFHPDLTESLCGFSDTVINNGNDFIADWSDACACGAGICPCGDLNHWVGASGSWDNSSLWSLGHVPLECESVVINTSDDVVTMPVNYQSTIYTLEVSGGAQLIIPATTEFTVLTDQQFVIETGCN